MDISELPSGNSVPEHKDAEENISIFLEGSGSAETAKLFSNWDLDGDGLLSFDHDIKKNLNLEDSFCPRSFFRMLDANQDGLVDFEDFNENIRVLSGKKMNDKIRLLFRFFGACDEESLTLEQVKSAVKVRGNGLLEMLGFMENGKMIEGKKLSLEELNRIFTSSETGEKAINSFCSALSTILERSKSHKSSTKVKTASISTAYVFVNKFGAAITVQLIIWIVTYYMYIKAGYPVVYGIAKGFGMNVYLVTVALLMTMLHSMKQYLHGMQAFQPLIPMHSNIELHSFLGFAVFFHSLGHGAAQIANLTIYEGFAYTVHAPAMMSGSSSWERSTSGDGISGYLLLSLIIVMVVTALMRNMNSTMYTLFRRCHYLHVVWVGLIIIHVPDLLYVIYLCAAVMGMFLLDALYKFVACTIGSTLRRSRTRGQVSYISVKRQPFQPPPIPGCYYRLMVPAVSLLEWHPFSLASSCGSDHLTFMVDSVGDWTRKVHELVNDPVKRETTAVYVQGPFVTATQHAVEDLEGGRPVMIVASGVGITPFLSVMATKVTDQEAIESSKRVFSALFREKLGAEEKPPRRNISISKIFQRDSPMRASPEAAAALGPTSSAWSLEAMEAGGDGRTPLHLIWSIRDCADLLFYIEYLHHLVESQSRLSRMVIFIDVYLTGLGSTSDPAFLLSQTLFYLLVGRKAGRYLRVHYGRPDLTNCLERVVPGAVYYCGGGGLKDTTASACRAANVPFFSETFDYSGRVGQWFKLQWQKHLAAKEKDAAPIIRKTSFIDLIV